MFQENRVHLLGLVGKKTTVVGTQKLSQSTQQALLQWCYVFNTLVLQLT